MPDSPVFPADELDEARHMNRQLRWAPRFRAPSRLGKLMIQTMLGAQTAFIPHGVPGVTTAMRRVTWKGHTFSIRTLLPAGEVHGVYLDFHGGGWAIGTAAMDDRVNARIAGAGLAVVSVDYTTLPDIDFPGMIAQCASAGDWAFEHAQSEFGVSTMFIGGESAGAHLAACALMRLRDTRSDFTRLRGAVLFYGPYDLSCTLSVRAAPPDTLVLDGPAMTSGLARLLPGRTEDQRRDPAFSPLYANLSVLPPALLLCGTIDPLIDDSRLMVERWNAASGNARLVIVPDAPHAFNRLPTRVASRTNAFVRAWIDARLAAAAPAQAAE